MSPILAIAIDQRIYSLRTNRLTQNQRSRIADSRPITIEGSTMTDAMIDSERALWLSEERHRIVIETISDYAILLIDPQGIIRDWNRSAESIFGFTKSEAIGRSADILFSEYDRSKDIPSIELATAAREGHAIDERWHVRKDGSRFFGKGIVTSIKRDGDILAYSKIVRDRTEQALLEADLRAERDRLEAAQKAAKIGTFEWEIGIDREIWNDEMYRVYQIPSGKVISRFTDWVACVHPDDRHASEMAFSDGIARHVVIACEFRILVPGGIRWLSLVAQPMYDEHGEPLRVVGTQVDITERKESELALKRINQDLEQFTAIASHDMQEPLRMISNFMGLLKRTYGEQLDSRANGYMDYAINGANRMRMLIENLLQVAKIDQGIPAMSWFPLDHVVVEAMDNLRERITETNASIEFTQLPIIHASRDWLVRVFQNLIGNALKYQQPEVPVQVRIETRENDHEWVVSVTDNGMGIPKEHHERIFGMFQRLHPDGTLKGCGIGLSVCSKIIQRHQGRLWVESVPHVGSTFYFSLPKIGPGSDGQRGS